MASKTAAVGGMAAFALWVCFAWAGGTANAQPAGEACGAPCSWVRTYGTGEGNPLQGGPETDMRLVAHAAAQPDGGSMLVGASVVGGDRGVWFAGLAPSGAVAWERSEPGNLCRIVRDASRGALALIEDRDTDTYRLAAYGGAGQLRWSLDLDIDEPGPIAALPDGGAVILMDTGTESELIRIDGGQGLLFDNEPRILGRDGIGLGRDESILPVAMAVLEDGSLIIAGFEEREEPVGLVVALDPQNEVLWRTEIDQVLTPSTIPCTAYGTAASIAPLAGSRLAVHFYFLSDVGVPESLLVVLNRQGEIQWTRDPADDDSEPYAATLATAMAPTADGGVLLAGSVNRPARRFGNWVERLASDGTILWHEDITQPDERETNVDLLLSSVAETPDGGALAVGTSDLALLRLRGWAIRVAGESQVDTAEPAAPTLGAQDLLPGVWSATADREDPVVVTFLPDGAVIVISRGRPERGRYWADFDSDPTTLDVEVDGDTFLGLVEFIDDDTFRMAMGEDERPSSFGDDGAQIVTFTRMSPRPTGTRAAAPAEASAPVDEDEVQAEATPPAGEDQTLADGPYAGSRQAVMDLLALVPDTPMGRDGVPLVSYVDIEATIEASYADAMPGLRFASLSFDDMFPGFMRIRSGPQNYMQYLPVIKDEISGLLGIDVQDVRRGLEFGQPPEWGTILGLDPAGDHAPAITAALNARDFQQRQIGDVTVWHRLDDLEMDIINRNPGDPFGGHLGQSARIAVLPPALIGSPVWPVAEGVVAAAGDARSLADDPVIAAAVEAITPPATEGALLQFQLFNVDDAAFAAMPVIDLIQDGQVIDPGTELPEGPAGTLPPYLMVAIADVFAGDRDEAIVALVYLDRGAAEAAAEVLADRFNAFRPASAPDAWANRLEAVGGTIAADVVEAGDGRFAVALTRISSPAVFPTDEQDGLLPAHGGMMFQFLIDALLRRDLTPLAILQ